MIAGCSAPKAEVAEAFRLVPEMNARRLFLQPTQPLPALNDPLLTVVDVDYLFISTKLRSCIADFPRWLRQVYEANQYVRVWWSVHHEPEQGTEAGDPTPAEYLDMYEEANGVVASLPPELRQMLRFGPTYTEYALRTHPGWDQDWEPVLGLSEVDFIASDCYNIGFTRYRTAEEMFGPTYAIARRYARPRHPNGLRVFIAECGQTRKGTDASGPSAGTTCASFIRSYGDYLMADRLTDGITWFWNHENRLNDRLPELEAWRSVVRKAEETHSEEEPPTPDPSHPQYAFGYVAGQADGEVRGFENGVRVGTVEGLKDVRTYIDTKLGSIG